MFSSVVLFEKSLGRVLRAIPSVVRSSVIVELSTFALLVARPPASSSDVCTRNAWDVIWVGYCLGNLLSWQQKCYSF